RRRRGRAAGRDSGHHPRGRRVPPAAHRREFRMTLTASLKQTANLVLVRMLTAGTRPPGPAQVRKDLAKFFHDPPSAEQWQEQIDELVEAGLVTRKPFRLTDAGRRQALEFLGLDQLPPGTTWPVLRSRYLIPKALGIPVSAAGTREQVARARG